ncbi:nucleotidyltransferase [Enterococcus nangangensis]|uniref:nucleotidyltransferase n=1 Tax=Enterococcus nangangensis TaxID=2559926 RepID=UPI00148579B6|nr:nucleotidyltransferase [Enterococcus nangangensis]
MKACGVVVEYNPFHLGHRYHLQKAREKSGADCVVAVMSGNWLQRGEPAILDKWTRAQIALANGCDLVVELPVQHALQSADFFARGAVTLLKALKVSSLCFGTENTLLDYAQLGGELLATERDLKEALVKEKHSGLSFPNQMKAAYAAVGVTTGFDAATPNHLLALSYAREVARLAPEISLVPITRVGSGYHEVELSGEFASATSIRQAALQKDFSAVAPFVPVETLAALKSTPLVSWADFFPFLNYQLTVATEDQLQKIYQMTEGLENLLKKITPQTDFSSLMKALKTKRYSYVRLTRLLSYVLLQLTQAEVTTTPNFLRVLGFNQVGQRYLSQIKKEVTLPLITKQEKRHHDILALSNRVDALYQLVPGVAEQITGRIPWRMD